MINNQTTINEIPKDILPLIFVHFNAEELVRAAAVCKAWRRAATDPIHLDRFIPLRRKMMNEWLWTEVVNQANFYCGTEDDFFYRIGKCLEKVGIFHFHWMQFVEASLTLFVGDSKEGQCFHITNPFGLSQNRSSCSLSTSCPDQKKVVLKAVQISEDFLNQVKERLSRAGLFLIKDN